MKFVFFFFKNFNFDFVKLVSFMSDDDDNDAHDDTADDDDADDDADDD